MNVSRNRRRTDRSLLLAARLLTAAIIVLTLYYARPLLVPVGLALLIAFMLMPAVRWMRRKRLPNGTAVGIAVTGLFLFLSLTGWIIAGQLTALLREVPRYKANLTAKIQDLRNATTGGSISDAASALNEALTESKPSVPGEPAPATVVISREENAPGMEELNSAGIFMSPLADAGFVFLLVILLLLKWSDLRGRFIGLLDHNLTSTTAALDDAATRVSRYLITQFLVNAGTGVLVWAGLALIGIPYAGLMGLCAGLFRYVPYVGPLAAAALPVLVSITTSASWTPVIAVAALFIVLELILNNIIEPWLYGTRLGVSEIGLILATVAWTFLWGPAGLVLATPLTVCLVVIGENVSGLAFISKLLGDRVQLPAHANLTQRLIAGDTIEAADILSSYRDSFSPSQMVDDVVIAALARIRHEQRMGHLDGAAASQIAGALPGILQDASVASADMPVILSANASFAFWGLCPLSETAARLMNDRFHDVPCRFLHYKPQQLATDVIADCRAQKPLGICLLHLDPSDFPRVTATLKRLRRALPYLPVIAARWGEFPLTVSESAELAGIGIALTAANPQELRNWIMPRALDTAGVHDTPGKESPEDRRAAPES